MPYKPINSEIDKESRALLENVNEAEIDDSIKLKANKLALSLRSRLMDLATWKADSTPEYSSIEDRCYKLTKIAGSFAHEALVNDFGKNT